MFLQCLKSKLAALKKELALKSQLHKSLLITDIARVFSEMCLFSDIYFFSLATKPKDVIKVHGFKNSSYIYI